MLIVCEFNTLNGGERSMLATLPLLAAAGIELVVAAPVTGALADELRIRGVSLLPFDTVDPCGARADLPQRRTQLAELIRHSDCDVLHANSLSMGRLSGPVAREWGGPSIAHLRDIIRLAPAHAADLNHHCRVLAVSSAVREWHVGQGLEPQRVHVLHNGVDLEQFQPRAKSGWLHRGLGIPSTARLLGVVGQLVQRKGLDILAAAARKFGPCFPDAHVALIGERYSLKDEAIEHEAVIRRDLVSALGESRVHFLGARDDVPLILPELAALVHAARQEPLGRVLLEAAACGVPIVATDVGGTREIFPPSANAALIAPPADPSALADAILAVLADPASAEQLGFAARRQAVARFDIQHATGELIGHYRAVADASARSGRRLAMPRERL